MTVSFPTTTAQLYGGAITADIASEFADASDSRPVPDSQEVFVWSTYDSDISLIFDILEYVPGSDEEALNVHWNDVVDGGKIISQEAVTFPNLPGRKAYAILGTAPDRRSSHHYTVLLMAILRLEEKQTDLVITVNVPHNKDALVEAEGTVCAPGENRPLSGARGELLQAGIMIQEKVLETFRINDWGLFA